MSKPALPENLFTLYGRKPVLEALQDGTLDVFRLHLSDNNRPGGILDDILDAAQARNLTPVYHAPLALSRISKNARQDQGVALDIRLPRFHSLESFLAQQQPAPGMRLLALDGVTNPQNVGMIIRSACAGGMTGILLPRKGSASLDALVIKASAGTLFRAPIIRCSELPNALQALSTWGAEIAALSGDSTVSALTHTCNRPIIYVLGNESSGISSGVLNMADVRLRIPMANGVESLNVAMAATVIAFLSG